MSPLWGWCLWQPSILESVNTKRRWNWISLQCFWKCEWIMCEPLSSGILKVLSNFWNCERLRTKRHLRMNHNKFVPAVSEEQTHITDRKTLAKLTQNQTRFFMNLYKGCKQTNIVTTALCGSYPVDGSSSTLPWLWQVSEPKTRKNTKPSTEFNFQTWDVGFGDPLGLTDSLSLRKEPHTYIYCL